MPFNAFYPWCNPFIRYALQLVWAVALAFGLSSIFIASVRAETTDGTITKIDTAKNTLTLNNGKTYNLPGEVDYSGFHVGQKVSVSFDTDPSGSYVTDIESPDGQTADTADDGEDDDTSAAGNGDKDK